MLAESCWATSHELNLPVATDRPSRRRPASSHQAACRPEVRPVCGIPNARRPSGIRGPLPTYGAWCPSPRPQGRAASMPRRQAAGKGGASWAGLTKMAGGTMAAMRRPRFQYRPSELLAFTGLLCLTIGAYEAADRLESQRPPSVFAALLLWCISIGAGGATVGTLFRLPTGGAIIAFYVAPFLLAVVGLVSYLWHDGYPAKKSSNAPGAPLLRKRRPLTALAESCEAFVFRRWRCASACQAGGRRARASSFSPAGQPAQCRNCSKNCRDQ